MPCRDGAFVYAICSNLLEHVTDPVAVAAELSRVADAGSIEVPEAASAKIVDFPSHLWWCRLVEEDDAPTLVFTAKTAPYFDPEIQAYIDRAGVRSALDSVLNKPFEHRVIQHHWTGTVRLRVEGELDPDFAEAAMRAEGHHRTWETVAAQLVTAVLTWPVRRRRGARPVTAEAVLRPGQPGPTGVLERKIYRLDA